MASNHDLGEKVLAFFETMKRAELLDAERLPSYDPEDAGRISRAKNLSKSMENLGREFRELVQEAENV